LKEIDPRAGGDAQARCELRRRSSEAGDDDALPSTRVAGLSDLARTG